MRSAKSIHPLITLPAWSILFGPTLYWLGLSWIESEYYSHGFIGLAVALAIWFMRLNARGPKTAALTPTLILIFGAGLTALGFFSGLNAIKAWSALLILYALARIYISQKMAVASGPAFLILACLVPIPFIGEILATLQWLTVRYSVAIAQVVLMLPVDYQGAVVYLGGGGELIIGETCSGFKSLIVLFTLTMAYLTMKSRSVQEKLILPVAAIIIALVSNIFRVSLMLRIATTQGELEALAFWDEWTGIVFYSTALFLMACVTWVIKRVGKKSRSRF